MSTEATAGILRTISNPIRYYLIQSLKGNTMLFSELVRACGLDPNSDTGTFSYHLSVLLDSNIIVKKDNEYQLTVFGNTLADLINLLQRESAFLLRAVEPSIGGDRMAGKIESRWLGQDDLYGQYGLIMGPPLETTHHEKWERPEDDVFNGWERALPQLDIPAPSFIGHVLGFEKDGIKLGSIHVRFSTKSLDGTRRAEVLGIYAKDNDYRMAGITRSSMLHQMMEEFLRQAKESKTQSVEMVKVDAEDEDLTMVLKELSFERCQTTYMMRKTI